MAYDFTVRTKQDLIDALQEYGIVPYFSTSIPGFSLEEHCPPSILFNDTEENAWGWKGPVIQATGCAYGKFFEKKAAYVRKDLFLDLANYRRDGYDFDARFDEGLASYRDKDLFDLIDRNAPVLTKQLKALGNYRKDGKKGFDTIITRLQAQCYVLISDFVYAMDKTGKPYGWGIAEYATPERLFGRSFTDRVYHSEPADSFQKLYTHLQTLFPDVPDAVIRRVLK